MEAFEESLDFLQTADRQTVARNIKTIQQSNSSLHIGKLLDELHSILAPYGYFMRALAATRLVQRTAYGYLYGYRNAMEQLPPKAVQAMMDRKLVINSNRARLGDWTTAIAKVPPPASGSAVVYARWAERMIAAKPKRLTGARANRVRKNPDALMDECFHMIERAWKRLPADRAIRERFARDLVGATMRLFDLKAAKFSPAKR